MGAYSHLYINSYPCFEARNVYYEELAKLIFQPEDFLQEDRLLSTRNRLVFTDPQDEPGDYFFKGFRQTVKVCRQRLELYGMNMKNAKADFIFAKKQIKTDYDYIYSFPIHKVSFQEYLDEIKYIMDNGLTHYDMIHTNLRDSLISDDLTIATQDIRACLYSILSLQNDEDIVEYDLSYIIARGDATIEGVTNIDIEKIIILTEGKTDVEFIQGSIKSLYPYLHPYYHFINFDEYKVESSASALVKIVLAFAGANVKHPIIVLFDNDTTGISEMNRIKQTKLPDNIKVLKLPDVPIARRYPTIGPSGKKTMNVNGSACGIEMYFGENILKQDGKHIPVRWVGYNEKERKYQGELQQKNDLQNRFREKLKEGLTFEYKEMDFLLNHIFKGTVSVTV